MEKLTAREIVLLIKNSPNRLYPTEQDVELIEEYAKNYYLDRIKNKLPENVFKVYDKKDAPKESVFVCEKIERNGIIDMSVPSYDYLKPNERIVYLFQKPQI